MSDAGQPLKPKPIIRRRPAPRVSREQIVYALVLDRSMKLGLIFLVVTFGLYVSGAVEPMVSLAALPEHWGLPANEHMRRIGLAPGWGWIGLVGKSDFLCRLGIAFLSTITLLCYLRVLPIGIKARDWAFGAIAIAEILVLVLAASGLASFGH
ncbi:MAG: hypothetical protein FJX47_17410 [Alphaproteobacteria bacterium]|nr:hypothetical protein [Alphaproteobacteria bacterium]